MIFAPIVFTGSGPLWRSTSSTAKSDSPNPSESMFFRALDSIERAAFQRITQV